jgi:hypothetical protein
MCTGHHKIHVLDIKYTYWTQNMGNGHQTCVLHIKYVSILSATFAQNIFRSVKHLALYARQARTKAFTTIVSDFSLEYGDKHPLNCHSWKFRSALLRVLTNGDTQTHDTEQVRFSITITVTKTPRTTQFQLPHSFLLRTVAVLRQESEYLTQWLGQWRRWRRNMCYISKRRRYLSVLQIAQADTRTPTSSYPTGTGNSHAGSNATVT